MLKWAVNGTHRQNQIATTSVPHIDGNNKIQTTNADNNSLISEIYQQKNSARRSVSNVTLSSCHHKKRNRIRRKSLDHDATNIQKKMLICNKENDFTSTPLPLTKQIHCHHHYLSPLRKLGSLKDLSNIATPETPTRKSRMLIDTVFNTPDRINNDPTLPVPAVQNNPLQYAATLPTFDVEYSPCNIIPGPLIALRGMGIADSYFEKPRYFSNESRNQLTNKTTSTTTETFPKYDYFDLYPKKLFQNPSDPDESSLSSSKMGDLTLDKMIDAILESARKDRRVPKSSKQSHNHVMSPTYTPAEDPASDLNEFWDVKTAKYRQKNDMNDILNPFNEREVKTPDFHHHYQTQHQEQLNRKTNFKANELCHLRRQRAVRRKRSTTMKKTSANFIKSTVKQSAQKLFSGQSLLMRNHNKLTNCANADEQQVITGNPVTVKMCNFSPDSGRNSASDLDESTTNVADEQITKRHLSFTPS